MLMKVSLKPLRGPKFRSRSFQAYLLEQTPERAAEILQGEKEFNDLHRDPGSIAKASERDYLEDTTTPAEWQTDLDDDR